MLVEPCLRDPRLAEGVALARSQFVAVTHSPAGNGWCTARLRLGMPTLPSVPLSCASNSAWIAARSVLVAPADMRRLGADGNYLL
jgi:hypothetical protein